MKVYVITSGEYSDYHIDAIALDKNEAVEKCATLNALVRGDDYCYIEEYDTEDMKISMDGKTNMLFRIRVLKNGGWEEFKDGTPVVEQESIKTKYYGSKYIICRAVLPADTTNEQAKKIMLDRIAEFKAKKAGI